MGSGITIINADVNRDVGGVNPIYTLGGGWTE